NRFERLHGDRRRAPREPDFHFISRLADRGEQIRRVHELAAVARLDDGFGDGPGQGIEFQDADARRLRKALFEKLHRRSAQVGRGTHFAQVTDAANPVVHTLGKCREKCRRSARLDNEQRLVPIGHEMREPSDCAWSRTGHVPEYRIQFRGLNSLLKSCHAAIEYRWGYFLARPADPSTPHRFSPGAPKTIAAESGSGPRSHLP